MAEAVDPRLPREEGVARAAFAEGGERRGGVFAVGLCANGRAEHVVEVRHAL